MTHKPRYFTVALIFLIFAVISFLTNILNPLIPEVKRSFGLSNAMAGLLPFAFFIAYAVMSIPAGILLDRTSAKFMTVLPFALACLAAFAFALLPNYGVYLISLFGIGLGMAMLQVTINPLLRAAGGEPHFAAFSVLGQLFFGAGAYLAPQVYKHLVSGLAERDSLSGAMAVLGKAVPEQLPWLSLYWVFGLVTLLMVLLLWVVRIPRIELTEQEQSGDRQSYLQLIRSRTGVLFFLGIFAYVGTEQGVGNWISEFLYQYHGVDPQTEGANVVSGFWAALTFGCLLGLVVIKLFDSRKVLIGASAGAMVALLLALISGEEMAKMAFPAVGFFASVMWSIIVSLALNSVASHHGSFSGILCTGIMGGAIVPLIVGFLADHIGLRLAMGFLFVTLAYILSIGIWARPLIANSTLQWRRLRRENPPTPAAR